MWKEVDAPGSSGERGGGAAAAGEEKEEKEEQEEEERGWNWKWSLLARGGWGKKSRLQTSPKWRVGDSGEGRREGVNIFQQQNR